MCADGRFLGAQRSFYTAEPLFRRPVEPVVFTKTFADYLPVNKRILTDIERNHMETEGLDAPEQAANREESGMLTLVCFEAVGDQLNIGFELKRLS